MGSVAAVQLMGGLLLVLYGVEATVRAGSYGSWQLLLQQ